MATISLLAPAPYQQFQTSSSTRYVADAFGEITGVPLGWDVRDLVADGCIVLGQVLGRNNLTATTDPVSTNDNTQDYAVGSIWVNSTNGRVWICQSAATSTAAWALAVVPGTGVEPATNLEQFGSGTATMLSEGNIYRYIAAASPVSPASTANDNVLANFALPANTLDGISNRGLFISATGQFATNANTKQVKVWAGASTATVGSAIVGGTAICDSGASTASNQQWELNANLFKYGAANSNTQRALGSAVVIGTTHSGFGSGASANSQLLTMTENATINITVTGNATTTATDITLTAFTINALN